MRGRGTCAPAGSVSAGGEAEPACAGSRIAAKAAGRKRRQAHAASRGTRRGRRIPSQIRRSGRRGEAEALRGLGHWQRGGSASRGSAQSCHAAAQAPPGSIATRHPLAAPRRPAPAPPARARPAGPLRAPPGGRGARGVRGWGRGAWRRCGRRRRDSTPGHLPHAACRRGGAPPPHARRPVRAPARPPSARHRRRRRRRVCKSARSTQPHRCRARAPEGGAGGRCGGHDVIGAFVV
jgi:hypothetical protein